MEKAKHKTLIAQAVGLHFVPPLEHLFLAFTALPTIRNAPTPLQSQTNAPPLAAPASCTAHRAYAPADTRKSIRYQGGCCAYYRRRGERPHRALGVSPASTPRPPGARNRLLSSEGPSGGGRDCVGCRPRAQLSTASLLE